MAKHIPQIGIIGLAVCTVTGEDGQRKPASRIQILPSGEFRGLNGLPKDVSAWNITDIDGKKLAAVINSRSTPIVIDYDHQTLYAARTGVKAIAAAWFSKTEWVDGEGLFALDTQWTDAAAAHIAADEFRYISPVFPYDRLSGRVTGLVNAALTNTPNIDGMADVAALAIQSITQQEEPIMDDLLEQLRWLLGLPVGSTAEDITLQMQKIIDQLKSGPAQATANFDLATYLANAQTAIAANSAVSEAVDPARYVPLSDLQAVQTELNALRLAINSQQIDALIEPVLASGALLSNQEAWARELGKKDVAALSQFVETLTPPAALAGMQTAGKTPPPAAGDVLTEDELAVCSQMGISEDEFRTAKSS